MTVSPAADRVTESFIDGEPVRSAATYPNIDPSTGVTLGDGSTKYLLVVCRHPQFLGPGPCGGGPGPALHAGVQSSSGHHSVGRNTSAG